MRLTVLLLIVMSLSQCAPKKGVMTEQEFANECIEAFRKKFPDVSFTLEPDFSISGKKDDQGMKFNLGNIYLAYETAPDSLKSIIGQYLVLTERGFAEKKGVSITSIVPVIKPAGYLDGIKKIAKGNTDSVGVVTEKYNDQLIIAYAQDSETSVEYLSVKTFRGMHISMDSLHSLAISNLKRVISSVSRDGDNGLYLIGTKGGYQTSVILLSSMWTKEALPVDGDWVIAMPNREVLFVTGSKSKDGMEKIKKLTAKSYKESSYQVSADLFKWNGKRFELYVN
jgi:uncharacterized protein YtpQ (UPF0354 family)